MDPFLVIVCIGGLSATTCGFILKSPSESGVSTWLWILYLVPPLGLVVHALLNLRKQPLVSGIALASMGAVGAGLTLWLRS